MDVFQGLGMGFAAALEPGNLFACFVGVLVGTLVGILPGLGPAATMAMLLPITYGMSSTTAIIMLAGVWYGSKYGGAVTSILVNLPGEASSVMTCMDGYPMARQGRAGPALGMAAIGSFFAGTIGLLGLMLVAPLLTALGLSFGPPEYFGLMAMGLTLVTFLAGKSMTKGLMAGCLGLAMATVGTDIMSGRERLTFGQVYLLSGIDLVVVAMGLFAVSEILLNLESPAVGEIFKVPNKLSQLLPSLKDFRESAYTLVQSSLIGFFVGLMPGGNAAVATFLSYGAAKAVARDPEVFGTGTIRGVAAAETADNAAASGGMVPLMTLGIPTNASMAILLGALIMTGLNPGPLLMEKRPDFFWAVVASMYLGNVLLLVMNLPLVPLFANLLRVPYYLMYPTILAISSIGVYSLNNSLHDVWLMMVFGLLGYVLRKAGVPLPPIVLALVLGKPMERALRQSFVIFDGNGWMFFQRPISAVLLAVAVLILLVPVVRALRARPSSNRPTASFLKK